MHATRFLVLSILAGAVAGSPARGQSVEEVVQGMYAVAERQAATVDDYTLTQLVMGTETFSYFEKELIDGHPVFRLQMSDGAGFSLSLAGEDYGLGDVFVYGPLLVEHGRYEGTEQIGNFTVHVIAVDDAGAMAIVPPSGASQEFTTKSVRLYIDANMLLPRRIVLTGDAATVAGPAELTIQIEMLNYLPIESLWVPFRTTINVAGATADVTVAEVLINAGRPEA